MGIKFISFLLLLSASSVFAQKTVVQKAIPITKLEFDTHLPVIDLITKPLSKLKSHGVIKLKTGGKNFVFKDDDEFLQFIYEGDLNTNSIAVIHELETNSEHYYLINKFTGRVDTLLNRPIFYTDKKSVICLEGPVTDMTQRIQIGKFENNHFITTSYVKLAKDPFIAPSYVFWSNEYTIFIATNDPTFIDTKFYKVVLKND